MTRAKLPTHTPAAAIGGDSCAASPSEDPKLLFLECGLQKLTVNVTAADTVWQLRASYDFTETMLPISDARAMLVARYGKPAGADPVGGLTWLPTGAPRGKADQCAAAATLLSAAIEQTDSPRAASTPLPSIDPARLPIRTAILAEHAGHRGVIVEVQDARPGIAELAPLRVKPALRRR